MLWSIDSCQKRVSADHSHMTASWAQVYNSWKWGNFSKLSTDQLFVLIDRRRRSIFLKVEFSLLSTYGQSIIHWRRQFLKHPSRASLSALAKSINYKLKEGAHIHQTMSRPSPVPHACAQPYNPGSGSHGQLFYPSRGSSAWYSRRVNKRGRICHADEPQ